MKTEKIKSGAFNNRRKVLTIHYASGKTAEVHYSQLGIRRNIDSIWVDVETRGRSLGIRLDNGEEDFMPYDQPLALTRDPEYRLQAHIERVIALINERLRSRRISKRFLAQQLSTSDNQIQRLLNPEILNKNLEQLYKIAMLLGLECELNVKRVA